jgi:hypothetical protein
MNTRVVNLRCGPVAQMDRATVPKKPARYKNTNKNALYNMTCARLVHTIYLCFRPFPQGRQRGFEWHKMDISTG